MSEFEKSMCIISSDNVLINGDVAFTKYKMNDPRNNFTKVFYGRNVENIVTENTFYSCIMPSIKNFKLWVLWVWHMKILKKDAVYLTGVLRK